MLTIIASPYPQFTFVSILKGGGGRFLGATDGGPLPGLPVVLAPSAARALRRLAAL